MRPYLAFLALFSFAAVPLAARAETLTLTETAMASGSLGFIPPVYDANPTFDTTVTITATFDSSAVTGTEFGYVGDASLLTYNIAGVGTFTSTNSGTFIALNQYDGNLSIGNIYGSNDILSTDSSFLDNPNGTTLSLATPFSTVGDDSTAGNDYTTGGFLDFTSVGDVTVTLTPTPEPSSLALLGTGVLGLAGAARRKMARH